jgi:virginiamycin B lyase
MTTWQGSGRNALIALGLAGMAPAALAQTITEFPGASGGGATELVRGPNQSLWLTDPVLNAIVEVAPPGSATTFAIPSANAQPGGIVSGPDGNVYFTETIGDKIGQITPTGVITEFPMPSINAGPAAIALGPDGNFWFVERSINRIGQMTTTGAVEEFDIPSAGSAPGGIKQGPDGAIWFAETTTAKLGRITTDGTITEYPLAANASPSDLAPGFDGNIWVLETGLNQLEVVSPAGTVLNHVAIPTANAQPSALRRGNDGNLWFTETDSGKIAQVTVGGVVTEYAPPTASSKPLGLAVGTNGDMWFVESAVNKIGQVLLFPSGPQLVASVLPAARSVETGNAATAFATVINTSSTAAHGCAIAPINGVANHFLYQTTNSSTNLPTGTANTPVDLPANGLQSFVFALTPQAAFDTESVSFGFYCSDADAAPIVNNVDTLQLSASATPVPDIIALGVTPGGDGILDITGTTGSSAFAVATDNIGSTDTLKVTINPGAVALPLDLSVCETDPSSGQCLAAPTRNLTLMINAGATPTFAFFATAMGAVVFDPNNNRLIVRFEDAAGDLRGATSVAVRTQ